LITEELVPNIVIYRVAETASPALTVSALYIFTVKLLLVVSNVMFFAVGMNCACGSELYEAPGYE
jgi:hypothetical protein